MMMGTKMAEEGKTRTKKNGTRWDEVWEDVGEVPGEGENGMGEPHSWRGKRGSWCWFRGSSEVYVIIKERVFFSVMATLNHIRA
jgi:hypothetical protein